MNVSYRSLLPHINATIYLLFIPMLNIYCYYSVISNLEKRKTIHHPFLAQFLHRSDKCHFFAQLLCNVCTPGCHAVHSTLGELGEQSLVSYPLFTRCWFTRLECEIVVHFIDKRGVCWEYCISKSVHFSKCFNTVSKVVVIRMINGCIFKDGVRQCDRELKSHDG